MVRTRLSMRKFAAAVRLDNNRCGPQGKWFDEVMGPDGLSKKSPVEELLESFDI